MVDLTKVKDVKFKLDESMKMRAQIGLNIGMTIGMLGAGIISVIFIENIWLRIFSGLGFFCAVLLQTFGCYAAIKQLQNYETAMKMFANTESSEDLKRKEGYIG